MATATTRQRVEKQLDQIQQIGSEEARAKIVAFPTQVIYEGRYALQQLKEQAQQNPELLEVIEPLAVALGWVAASTFFVDSTKEREILHAMNGQQSKSQFS